MNDDSHKFSHIFLGIKFSLVSLVLVGASIWQAATGFLGSSVYMRVVYPVLGLLLVIPFGLFAYAMFNQPKLRQNELESKSNAESSIAE